MEMGGWASVDESFMFTLEATGDSEIDSDLTNHGIFMEEDDAESCSYELLDCGNVNEISECDVGSYAVDEDDEDIKEGDEGEEMWDSQDNKQELGIEKQKSYVSVDSNCDFMNEMERSRLFWEACLAS